MSMDKDKQRIAIAEACGWKLLEGPRTDAFGCHEGIGPKTMKWTLNGNCSFAWQQFKEDADRVLPDYLNDLNAMAIAEMRLGSPELQNRYQAEILEVTYNDYERRFNQGVFNQLTATAAQRAEAFLRTLNLWTPTGEENE